jgi:hypothetical protein
MSTELKKIAAKLAPDLGLQINTLLASFRKSIRSGRISEKELITLLNKLID